MEENYAEHKPLYNEIENLHETATANNSSIQELLEAANSAVSTINENQETTEALAESHEAKSTGYLESINNILETANSLKADVASYQEEFERFDKSLQNRNSNYEKQKTKVDELQSDLEVLKEQISSYEEEARGVLGKAVVAGLSGTFKATVKELSNKLKSAQNWYYGALMTLLGSTIVVVTNGFGFIELSNLQDANTTYKLVSAIFWKFMLIAPAVLFVRFTGRRYQSLFELREHYAYKDSIAASVEGFKAQSGEHSNLIAAATFFELTLNPIEQIDGKDDHGDHPNPVLSKIAKLIEGQASQK